MSGTSGILMSHTPQQAVRDAASSMGAEFEIIIGEVTEDIETVETRYIETDDTTPPTMVDSVVTWWDINGEEAVSVVAKPKIGGLFVDDTITDKEKWVLIHFFGTDPDANTKVWS